MKSWLGKLAVALIVPVALLAAVEGVLRGLDVGYPSDFLVEATVNGEPAWVDNPFFTYQYFSPPLARMPAPIVAAKAKPEGVFRVVVLGESAAQGDPIPDFGPPRLLEYTLRHRDPLAKVEVINAAITAINSHVIRRIARELPKLQPDLVVLYIGNNEVIGPYGPGTVFSGFLSSDAMIRVSEWAGQLRLTHLLRFALYAVSAKPDEPEEFRGVSMFMDKPVRADDPRLDAVYRRHEDNLRSIIQSARAAGADVLLSTVAVNASDCPPAISVHRDGLSVSQLAEWQAHFDQGGALARKQVWDRALVQFESAQAIDNQYAELHYNIGTCLRGLGRREEARVAFARARDLDAFRYRTDSRMNDTIRRIAAVGEPRVFLVDADAEFARGEKDDADLFVDHVHFSFAGTARLAGLWSDAILSVGPRDSLVDRHANPDPEALKETVVYTRMAEISVVQEMHRRYRKAPFDRQFDNTERVADMAERIKTLSDELRDQPAQPVVEAYRRRMAEFPDDLYFAPHLAQFLISQNRFLEAEVVARDAVQRYPHRRGPRSLLAYLLARRGRSEEAASVLFGFQRKHGYQAVTASGFLFSMLASGGEYDEAARVGRAMERVLRPSDFRSRVKRDADQWRFVADRMREARNAVAHENVGAASMALTALLERRPDLPEARFLMGTVQVRQGNPGGGVKTVQQAIAAMNFCRAHYHGALWQAKGNHPERAIPLMEKAVSLAGDDWTIVNSLAWIRLAHPKDVVRNPGEARRILEEAIARTEDPPAYLLDTLTAVLSAQGELAAALVMSDRAAAAAAAQGDRELAGEIARRREHLSDPEGGAWMDCNRPINYF